MREICTDYSADFSLDVEVFRLNVTKIVNANSLKLILIEIGKAFLKPKQLRFKSKYSLWKSI